MPEHVLPPLPLAAAPIVASPVRPARRGVPLACFTLALLFHAPVMAQEAPAPSSVTPATEPRASTFLGDGTTLTLGVGTSVGPAYAGAKTYRVRPVPLVDATFFDDRVFLSTANGLGANIINLGPFQSGLAITYGGGRSRSDSERLRGLSDVAGGAAVVGFLKYRLRPFSFELKATNNFGPNPGAKLSFASHYSFTPLSRLLVSVGPEVTWADHRYNQAYFGVTSAEATQASAQGNPLRAYSPGSGINDVSLSLSGVYAVTDHWQWMTNVRLSELVGNAAKNSPLTQRQFQPGIMTGVAYKF
ncbi:MAG: MipA/OmpV family protein [Azospirillaceae bacterium]|nr:MipA/OmpV family protein [Azospirillaceae bacterium]